MDFHYYVQTQGARLAISIRNRRFLNAIVYCGCLLTGLCLRKEVR